MRQSGVLVEWNDARGFGFIDRGDGSRCFVHVSAISGTMRPRIGDRLHYHLGFGHNGRPQAVQVKLATATPASRTTPASTRLFQPARLGLRSAAAIVLVGVLTVALLRGTVPLPLAGIYGLASLLAVSLYRHDKGAAQTGEWRVSEATLHAIDLGGGIIGGLLAQERLCHKTRKPGFVTVTGVIAAMHLLWLGGLASGFIIPVELSGFRALLP